MKISPTLKQTLLTSQLLTVEKYSHPSCDIKQKQNKRFRPAQRNFCMCEGKIVFCNTGNKGPRVSTEKAVNSVGVVWKRKTRS